MCLLRNITVLLLVLTSFGTHASHVTDSLKALLDFPSHDTSKVTIFNQLTKQYINRYPDSAVRYGLWAYELAKKIENMDKQGIAARNIGVAYMNQAEYEKALAYLLESVRIFEKVGNQQGLSLSYNNIGSVNFHTTKFEEALSYYKKSLDIKLRLGMSKEASSTYINIGNIFMKEEKYDSCIKYYQLGLENARKNNDDYNISVSLMNIGEAYIDIEKYKLALQHYTRALDFNEDRKDLYHIANCYFAIGKIYTGTGAYKQSEEYLHRALDIARPAGFKSLELNILKHFSQLFEKKEDYQQALLWNKKYHELNDSIYSFDNSNRIDKLKARYETELKDKQIAELNKNKALAEEKAGKEEVYRNGVIAVAVLIGILCIVLLRNTRLKQRSNKMLLEKNREIEIHRLEIELKNKELNEFNRQLMKENISTKYEILKAKINPHFLFNSLSTLSTLIIQNPKEAVDFVGRFSKLYRSILKSSENPLVSLQEELDFTGHYLYLQKMRFGNSLQVTMDISALFTGHFVPPFTLQLLVENAIKHNIISTEQKLSISIIAANDYIMVSNNLQKKPAESSGIGQSNIRERYRLLEEKEPEFVEKNGYYIAKIPLVKVEVTV
ncbi:MAG TPA: tetratricopeptide repeat protein [Bacteroidia bacterium]|nr:tetratricopeptide repeat protein [Bacteroidia bacterium]